MKGSKRDRASIYNVLSPLMIMMAAVVLTSILMLCVGANPVKAYGYLLEGAFGSQAGMINTVNKTVPICLSGFAVAIAKKAGIFNIGVEGQLIFGAFGSALAGIYLKGIPAVIHIPAALAAGMLFGMAYALVPSVLYIKRGVNLLVVFILMNNVVKLLLTYFVVGPFASSNSMVPSTEKIADTAMLPYLAEKPARLSIGILIVLLVLVILYIYLYKTRFGYELRVCGDNREAARYAGIPVKKYLFLILLAGGALGGLAGSIEVLGNYHRLYDGFSPGYGFDGIPIALLANGNPVGVLFGSFLFGALRAGSIQMQAKAGVSGEIVAVTQGALVTLIACEAIIRFLLEKLDRKRRGEKA